jgi:pyroglutamyl-peptidase
MKTLLTGFNRFGNLAVNPSEIIVRHFEKRAKEFPSVELITEVLPTEFVRAGERIKQLIRQYRPDQIVCLGVGANLIKIHLERVALNLDDADVADNTGLSRDGQQIVPDAPVAYWSTLPLERLSAMLADRGIPTSISNHAGTYVCNHVFYVARHEVEVLGLNTRCGFVHLPGIFEKDLESARESRGLPLKMMIDAIECCLM